MRLEWDEAKREANLRKHGIDFAEFFDTDTALTESDARRDYGEIRFVSLGFIGARLHALVFTPRDEGVRVIGLRKANARERRRYDANKKA